jgi:hypothetical protein
MQITADAIQMLVQEEIRREVADAIATRSIIFSSACSKKILSRYPECGLTARYLADEIILFAAKAGVPVAVGEDAPPRFRGVPDGLLVAEVADATRYEPA